MTPGTAPRTPGADTFIGLMSGTSGDGVDGCVVRFTDDGAHLVGAASEAFPDDLRQAVLSAAEHVDMPGAGMLDVRLADAYTAMVETLLRESGLRPADIRAIGMHGQNVLHDPDGPYPTSIQLGDPNRVAVHTGIDVVADLRRADIAAGGQGAPLAPGFHAAMLAREGQARAVVNIGGIANVTLLGPAKEALLGFDTGPGNALIDGWIERQHGPSFDADGAWAAAGRIDDALLARMLADPYFARTPPKSTGREHFNQRWVDAALRAHPRTVAAADVQATLAEVTVRSIADAIDTHKPAVEAVFVCGGGAYNRHLMDRLRARLGATRSVETTEAAGIAPLHVEPMAFAWLAHRRVQELPGNRPEVTGAARPLVLGSLVRAPR